MRPHKRIPVRLLDVQVLNNSPSPALGRAPKNAPPKTVTVMYLFNRAKYSFIAKSAAKQLLITNYEWRYPGLKHTKVTAHLVVRDSPFQIVLRKQDWEQPIRSWLMTFSEQELRENGILQSHEKKVGESSKAETTQPGDAPESIVGASEIVSERDSDTESVTSKSSTTQSRSSTATTISISGDCTGGNESENEDRDLGRADNNGDEQGNEEAESDTVHGDRDLHNEGEAKDNGRDQLDSESEWPDIEIVSTKSEHSDIDDDEQADAYWTWSPEQHRWFHENEDKSLAWFPRLV
ncbi:hypothetical protein BKA56DRAFT_365515 [Ilyonectria sp. MPI-CAGE-AT-0026]|nr:hypothetical protein BKA56DRAFT_365515 [Ilyonectria sp. MPI-CAGE-AT-0026]